MAKFRSTIRWNYPEPLLRVEEHEFFPGDRGYDNMMRWSQEGWSREMTGPSIVDPEGIHGDTPRQSLVELLSE